MMNGQIFTVLKLPKGIFWRTSWAFLVTLALFLANLFSGPNAHAASQFEDFNTGSISDTFHQYNYSGSPISISASGGISNSKALTPGFVSSPSSPKSSTTLLTSKNSYALGGVGSTYEFSAFAYSGGNAGYFGFGFSSQAESSTVADISTSRGTTTKGLSIAFHGGGFDFVNNSTITGGSWHTNYTSGDLRTIKAGTRELINSTTESPDRWYKVVGIITRDTLTTFDFRIEVWPANADGTLRQSEANAIFELRDQTNTNLTNAPSIYTNIAFGGSRATYFDNFAVDLNGSSVIQAGAPVVLTNSATTLNNVVTVAGQVTSDGGAAVTARGIVYSTSQSPTLADIVVTSGSGTGSFSADTPTLSAGTYYLRTYATNSTGTSYGEQVTVTIAAPADSTPPLLLSSVPADSASFVSNAANLTLTFDEPVIAGTGNLTVVPTADPSAAIAIDVTSGAISFFGSTMTVNPAADLALGTSYHVLLDATAVTDLAGNPFAGISLTTELNFQTAKVPTSGLSVALDAALDASYPGTGSTWSDLSPEANHLILYGSPSVSSSGIEYLEFSSASSQYGDFAAPDLLDPAAYTKLVWFQPTALTAVNNLFSSRGTAAHAFWGGGGNANCTAAGDNLAAGHNQSWLTVQSEICLETQWQLGVVSFDSQAGSPTEGWRLYQNGVLVGQDDDTTPISGANAGYISQIARYGTTHYFDGRISQVYLYDRALSPAQVNAIFEASADYFGLALEDVTLDANGGSVDLPLLRSRASDGLVTLRTPTRANAEFLGWFTAPTGGTRVGGGGDTYEPQADVTLHAQWADIYTVTLSPGTNATVSSSTISYVPSQGPVTLPSATRADYVFDGWFSAQTGGNKIGNPGDSFTPGSNLTLHGRWTQASLAGISQSDLTEVNSSTIQTGVGVSNTLTVGSSSVTVSIPADALPAGTAVRIYSVANNSRAQALLPNESDFVNSIVLAWTAPDTTVPVASANLSMVIVDANIKSGAKVFSIVGNQSTLLATATQDGSVTINFSTDPLITIANPVVAPTPISPPPSSSQSTPAPAPPTPPATSGSSTPYDSPALDGNGELTVGPDGKLQLVGQNLNLVSGVSIAGQEVEFVISAGGAVIVTVPALAPGNYIIKLSFAGGKIEREITIPARSPELKVEPENLNAGSFNGVVVVYVKGQEGKRLSAKIGKDWVVVPSLSSNFERVVDSVGVGRTIQVKIYIDRKLVRTVELTTR